MWAAELVPSLNAIGELVARAEVSPDTDGVLGEEAFNKSCPRPAASGFLVGREGTALETVEALACTEGDALTGMD